MSKAVARLAALSKIVIVIGSRSVIVVVTVILTVSGLMAGGCTMTPPESPDSERISATISAMYKEVGGAVEVRNQQVLGKHYQPGSDSWEVVACTDITLANQQTIQDCNDSFQVVQLDSGSWILRGTVNGNYRWMEIIQR